MTPRFRIRTMGTVSTRWCVQRRWWVFWYIVAPNIPTFKEAQGVARILADLESKGWSE